jgi:hypothetical protein
MNIKKILPLSFFTLRTQETNASDATISQDNDNVETVVKAPLNMKREKRTWSYTESSGIWSYKESL